MKNNSIKEDKIDECENKIDPEKSTFIIRFF